MENSDNIRRKWIYLPGIDKRDVGRPGLTFRKAWGFWRLLVYVVPCYTERMGRE